MQRHSADLSKRLAHYGITEAVQKDVHISKPVTWNDDNCPFYVKAISTGDLDELKRLIGRDDSTLANEEPSSAHKSLASLATLPDDSVFEAASAYIFGNSASLKHHKAAIEKKLGVRTVNVAAANDLVISSVITYDSGSPAVINANSITFMPGGQIVCLGSLSVTANSIINQTA